MPEYIVECTGDAREVYHVEAEDLEDLSEKFGRGDFPNPTVTECSTAIDNVKEVPE